MNATIQLYKKERFGIILNVRTANLKAINGEIKALKIVRKISQHRYQRKLWKRIILWNEMILVLIATCKMRKIMKCIFYAWSIPNQLNCF